MLECDGLNLGCGQYFQYKFGGGQFILCRNADDFEVVEMSSFPFMIYARMGGKNELAVFEPHLDELGIEYRYGDYVT